MLVSYMYDIELGLQLWTTVGTMLYDFIYVKEEGDTPMEVKWG